MLGSLSLSGLATFISKVSSTSPWRERGADTSGNSTGVGRAGTVAADDAIASIDDPGPPYVSGAPGVRRAGHVPTGHRRTDVGTGGASAVVSGLCKCRA